MRHYLSQVVLQVGSDLVAVKAKVCALEVTETGDWRVILQGLMPETLVLLQDLFGTPHVVHVQGRLETDQRVRGDARVAKLSVGNLAVAVLEGTSNLA